MVKHTQTIRRLWPTNYLSVFDHFVGLMLKGLRTILKMVILRKIVEQVDYPYKLMKIDVDNINIHLPQNKLKLLTETSMLLTISCSESKKEMFRENRKAFPLNL